MIEQEKTNELQGYQRQPEPETKQQLMRMQEETILAAPDTYKEIQVTGLVRVQHTKYHKAGRTYQISMTLGDFFSTKHQVDFWEEEKKGTTDQGYQRNVEKQRAREFARYTIAGNQSYSNYIFSIRDVDADMVDIKDSDDGQTAVITIREGCPIWIVDGSHRAFGLDDSQADFENKPDILRDYQMPVSLTIGQTKREEVEQFVTENKMHKGVATDLAQHCINDMTETGDQLETRGSKVFKDAIFIKNSFAVVQIVNNDSKSPFWDSGYMGGVGRLRAPNKSKGAAKHSTVSASAFSSSLKPLMGTKNSVMHIDHKSSAPITPTEISEVLIKWWSAWAAKCPEPFKSYNPSGHNPNDFVIQQNIGIYSLNKVLAMIDHAFSLKVRTMSQKQFEDLIDTSRNVDPANWMKGTGYWSKKGTNQKSFGVIADEIIESIRQENPHVVTKLGGIP